MPAFYISVYVITLIICVFVVKTRTSYPSAAFLTAFAYAGGNDALWTSGASMAAYEMLLLFPMFFLFQGKFGTRFMLITLLMIAANVVCVAFELYESIRQSLVSILFFSACVITLKASYNTRELRKKKAELGHDSIYAFEESVIPFHKMVQ